MSVRVYSMSVLSCVGSGLSPIQGALPTDRRMQSSRLILMGDRPEASTEGEANEGLPYVKSKVKKSYPCNRPWRPIGL
jgi:hypothetical protein